MTYAVLEIQKLNNVPIISSKPLIDSSDLDEVLSIYHSSVSYWLKPPVGITLPSRVSIVILTEDGRIYPGHQWSRAYAQQPQQTETTEEPQTEEPQEG